MTRRCLTIVLFATLTLGVAAYARAETPASSVAFLRARVTLLPTSLFLWTGPRARLSSATSLLFFLAATREAMAASKPGPALSPPLLRPPLPLDFDRPLQPVDNGLVGRVARWLDKMRPPPAGGPRDAASRNPTIRDPARERDATSFDIDCAPLSGLGAGIAAAGAGAGLAQVLDLGGVTKELPLKIAPILPQGGGGVMLRLKW